jgi:hypothetical protein
MDSPPPRTLRLGNRFVIRRIARRVQQVSQRQDIAGRACSVSRRACCRCADLPKLQRHGKVERPEIWPAGTFVRAPAGSLGSHSVRNVRSDHNLKAAEGYACVSCAEELSPIPRQLPLSPMLVFPVGEHALDVAVQGLQHCDPRVHDEVPAFGGTQQAAAS